MLGNVSFWNRLSVWYVNNVGKIGNVGKFRVASTFLLKRENITENMLIIFIATSFGRLTNLRTIIIIDLQHCIIFEQISLVLHFIGSIPCVILRNPACLFCCKNEKWKPNITPLFPTLLINQRLSPNIIKSGVSRRLTRCATQGTGIQKS